ncbi:MFS transporter [Aureimonas populi]|uniref:MFS transporter n=1 Tax=Aureimonas populi TaxID=1701758 RepID=A0ABW5CQX4_9HYPH|nr:MFS transporter [Aureimonas populi]
MSVAATRAPQGQAANRTTFAVLFALSLCHLLNDTIQSLLPALYPVLQANYALTFTQIGILHFTFQVTASLLQPAVGFWTDRRPRFRLLTLGMGFSLVGLLILAGAHSYAVLLIAAAAIGIGSSIFHPDASRVARAASGGRYGFAQSIFQVGGNTGTAMGPLLAAYVVLPLGQPSVAWFGALALLGMIVLWKVGTWAKAQHLARAGAKLAPLVSPGLSRGRVAFAVLILALLVFSKQIYTVSLSSYYTFYLIEVFGVSIRQSQILLFLFLASAALGTLLGGPLGDRIGRKAVIWFSILGVLPFTLALPYADLFWTAVLTVAIGLILSSAFSAIVVFAQELMPGRVGLVAGIFFGFAFGMGGIGAAVLGAVADARGIETVFVICSFLPLLGLLTILLPPEPSLRRG